MKRKMRFLPVMLIIMMLVAGCGENKKAATVSPEEMVQASYAAMAEMKSYSMDLDMKMTMDMGDLGKMDMTMLSQADVIMDPVTLKMESETTVSADGQTQNMPMTQYIVTTDTGVVLYQNMLGQWYQMAVDDPALVEAMQMDPADSMKVYTENMEKVELLGEENVGDRACSKIEVTLAEGAFDEVLGSFAGGTSGALDDQTLAAAKDMLAEMGGMKMVLWIDKENNQLLKESVDMSEVIGKVMAASLKSAGVSDEELAQLKECTMTMEITYKDYNNVQEIVVPEEAKTAQDLSGMM